MNRISLLFLNPLNISQFVLTETKENEIFLNRAFPTGFAGD
jgi:hypothetical protein